MRTIQFPFNPLPLALLIPLALTGQAAFAEETRSVVLDPVVVTGSRVEHSSFDLPASIDVVSTDQINAAQARVNVSEALAAVPGVVVLNRQNYAQDLQISSRGFGARSAFGVRGVRLIADGIPATMPDGQGQAATFDLDVADRMEVARGPISAVYGNHGGGVIQLFTRDGHGDPTVTGNVSAGSYGSWKADVTAEGSKGNLGYIMDGSRFATDGYRRHSSATRDQSFAKLTQDLGEERKLSLVVNSLSQHDTEDPLGLTKTSLMRNPRDVDPAAITYNTRKSIDHVQGGVTFEQPLAAGKLQLAAYTGTRSVIQYQSTPPSVQSSGAAALKSSGAVVDFDRTFFGTSARWTGKNAWGATELTTTLGMDLDRSEDDRKGYNNYTGLYTAPTQVGVKGNLRRSELDRVTSLDPYIQGELNRGPWSLVAGIRHSRVLVEVQDRFLSNGNDSGRLNFGSTTPTVGLTYKINPVWNVYGSVARSIETPTLNELFYSGSGGGFNFGLQPAKSLHRELGTKVFLGDDTRANLALFQVNTENELVIDASSGGRTSYRNATRTLRQGVEASIDSRWQNGWSARASLTAMRAFYDQAFTSSAGLIKAGNRMPGVPDLNFYSEAVWKDPASAFSAGIELLGQGRMFVEDTNTQMPAHGFAVVNLRGGFEQKTGDWKLKEFMRLNNLFDKAYVGSVIVGDTNNRFYEPAPGTNWLLGMSAQSTF